MKSATTWECDMILPERIQEGETAMDTWIIEIVQTTGHGAVWRIIPDNTKVAFQLVLKENAIMVRISVIISFNTFSSSNKKVAVILVSNV